MLRVHFQIWSCCAVTVQGDTSRCFKPPVDTDLKLRFSISHLYQNATATGGLKQRDVSPCIYWDLNKLWLSRHLIKEGILPPIQTSKPKKSKKKKAAPPPSPPSSGTHPSVPATAGSSMIPTATAVQEAQDAANRASWNNCAFPGRSLKWHFLWREVAILWLCCIRQRFRHKTAKEKQDSNTNYGKVQGEIKF